MITDVNHPIMARGRRSIEERVKRMLGKPFPVDHLPVVREAIETSVRNHREWMRNQGVEFPELVVFMLVMDIGTDVRLYPRDMDRAGIEAFVVQFCQDHPKVSMIDLAREVERCWPGAYRVVH